MFMLKALGVILGIGLSVVFFTVLLGLGWVALLVVLRLLPLILLAGLVVWAVVGLVRWVLR